MTISSPANSSLPASPYPLYDLTRAVASAKGLPDIFEAALICLNDSLGVARSAILLFDQHDVMRFQAWRGLSSAYRQAVNGHSPWTPSTREPQPVLVEDVRLDESLSALRQAIVDEGILSLAFIPVGLDQKLLGKFMLYYAEPHAFDDDEVLLAQTIASQVAFAIEQHQFREEQLQVEQLLTAQKQSLELLARGEPLSEVLMSLARTADDLAGGASAASIMLLDSHGKLHDAASPALSQQYLDAIDGLPADANVGTCCAAAARAEVVITEDIESDPGWTKYAGLPLAEGFRAAWSQPIIGADSEVLGTFGTYFRERRRPTKRETELVAVLAQTAALAIERSRDAQAYHLQNANVEAIFRSTITGLAEMDAESLYTLVNDRFCEIVGRSREELVGGLSCFDLTHPDDLAETKAGFDGLQAISPHFSQEKRYVRPDGAEVWATTSISAVHDSVGNFTGAVAVVTDRTQNKLAENAILESEHRYRQLVQGLGLAVYTTDAEGRILMFNEAAADLWGRRPELLEERWCGSWRIFTPEGEPMALSECPMAIALKENRTVRNVEIMVERPDGKRGLVQPYPTPLRDAQGNLIGAVNVLVDITERKKAEEAIKQSAAIKDQFLSLVSHELRTPIATILGNGLLLDRRSSRLSDANKAQALSDIISESEKLQAIIENLLTLTRMESGQEVETEVVDLPSLLARIIEEFERGHPGCHVGLTIDPGLPPALAQPALLELVVQNLLSNAVKYSAAGAPIEVIAREGPDGRPEVRVRDNGIGIDPAEADNLFAPFFRSPRTREVAKGIGLGLAVCKRVLDVQNGTIHAERRGEGGSDFVFSLRPAGSL